MEALVLIDLQLEFFDPTGILQADAIPLAVAERAAELIGAWPADRPIVCVTSCYDRWAHSEPPLRFVEPVDASVADVNKSERLAGSHRGAPCCVAGTALSALVPAVATALSARRTAAVEVCKEFFSAFVDTDLERVLRDAAVETVVLAGVTTSRCVQATAIDARRRGFRVELCVDASAAATAEAHERNVAALEALGVWTIRH